MKLTDIILGLLCGTVIGSLASDFIGSSGLHLAVYYNVGLWIFFPLVTIFCLWLASEIGKKWLFVFQSAKFALVGAFATVLDLQLFEALAAFISVVVRAPFSLSIAKGISFLITTTIKYLGNKYWTFQKHQKEHMPRELLGLVIIDLIGLVINVFAFNYMNRNIGPHFGISAAIWLKLSVIVAGLAAAISNFLGYKFLVFKK